MKKSIILGAPGIFGLVLMIAAGVMNGISKSTQYNLIVWVGFGILVLGIVVIAISRLVWVK